MHIKTLFGKLREYRDRKNQARRRRRKRQEEGHNLESLFKKARRGFI